MPSRARKVCLVAVIAAGSLACSSPAEQQLEAGRRALGRGHYRDAVALYAEVIIEAPGSPQAAQALYDMGVIHYLRLRDIDAARDSFRKLLSEYGESAVVPEARRMLARMYEEDLGEPQKALDEYMQLLAEIRDPAEQRAILLAVADCRYELNDLGAAADDFRHVIEDFPYDESSDQAFLRLARIEVLEGRPAKALNALEALLENTDQPESRYRAFLVEAEVLLDSESYQQVRICLARADREFPEDSKLTELALRLSQQEQRGKALDDGASDSQELLEELQGNISWGKGRRPRRTRR